MSNRINWESLGHLINSLAQSGDLNGVVEIDGLEVQAQVAHYKRGEQVATELRNKRAHLIRPCAVTLSGEESELLIAALLIDEKGKMTPLEPTRTLRSRSTDPDLLSSEITDLITTKIEESDDLMSVISGRSQRVAGIVIRERVLMSPRCSVLVYTGTA